MSGAIVGERAEIGAGCDVRGLGVVGPGAKVGDGNMLDHGLRVAADETLAAGSSDLPVTGLDSPNIDSLDRWAFDVTKVEKPWGYELIWALTDVYCGKVLFVKAGAALSLQFHNDKDESWLVQSGRAKLELGEVGQKVLSEEVIGAGAAFRYRPGTVHRVTAIEDTTILEVSTPQLDDVVRLDDLYGREGTSEA